MRYSPEQNRDVAAVLRAKAKPTEKPFRFNHLTELNSPATRQESLHCQRDPAGFAGLVLAGICQNRYRAPKSSGALHPPHPEP
jgi:hypothetical protein